MLTPLWGGAEAGRPFSTFWFVSGLAVAAVLYRLLDALPDVACAGVACAVLGLGYLAGPELARLPLAIGTAV